MDKGLVYTSIEYMCGVCLIVLGCFQLFVVGVDSLESCCVAGVCFVAGFVAILSCNLALVGHNTYMLGVKLDELVEKVGGN